jgi:outer membrane protein assembly factor BamB
LAGVPGRFSDEMQTRRQLETIRRGIQAGRVGGNELEWLACLMEIAAGSVRQGGPAQIRRLAPITQRIEALNLLSRIGSMENIPWLVWFFRRVPEPLVKAAAAQAIGGIGVDPDGRAMQAFLAAAISGHPVHDEQVLLSVAAATGALCRFSGPPLSDIGSQILMLLSDSSQQPSVQRQARRELGQISR